MACITGVTVAILVASCSTISDTMDAYSTANQTFLDPTDIDIDVIEHDQPYRKSDPDISALYLGWYSLLTSKDKHNFSGFYVFIDGKIAGAVKHKTHTVIELGPGSYTLGVGDSSGPEKQMQVQVVAGYDLVYRAGITSNVVMPDTLYLEQLKDREQVRALLTDTRYVMLAR